MKMAFMLLGKSIRGEANRVTALYYSITEKSKRFAFFLISQVD